MDLSCSACGARFRSMSGEARHRHNFPALCRRNARFTRWSQERNAEAVGERITKLPEGALFRIVTTDAVRGPYVVYERMPGEQMECVVNTDGRRPGDSKLGAFDIRTNVPRHWLRIEPIAPEHVDAYHMRLRHGLVARATQELAKLSGHLT